jgi:hypothetical protein
LAAICFLILILSAGCAALSPITAKQETLEERVKSYMQAQIDRKWDRAYSFFDSSSRERISRESFMNTPRKLSYKGFKIEGITMLPSGDQASVKVTIDVSFTGYDFKGALRTQNWVKERGSWFVKIEPQSRSNPFTPPENQK